MYNFGILRKTESNNCFIIQLYNYNYEIIGKKGGEKTRRWFTTLNSNSWKQTSLFVKIELEKKGGEFYVFNKKKYCNKTLVSAKRWRSQRRSQF